MTISLVFDPPLGAVPREKHSFVFVDIGGEDDDSDESIEWFYKQLETTDLKDRLISITRSK